MGYMGNKGIKWFYVKDSSEIIQGNLRATKSFPVELKIALSGLDSYSKWRNMVGYSYFIKK